MQATMLAALAGILLVAADGGRYQSEPKFKRGWKDLVGEWKAVAWEEPDGKRSSGGVDPHLTVKSDAATGHLALLVSPGDSWLKLEIDPEKRPNLYWIHYEIVLPPRPSGTVGVGRGSDILWAHPDVVTLPDGTGVLRQRVPVIYEVDGDTMKSAWGYEVAGMWNAPEWLHMKDRSGSTYYTRVSGKR